jgi:hypothetical protein
MSQLLQYVEMDWEEGVLHLNDQGLVDDSFNLYDAVQDWLTSCRQPGSPYNEHFFKYLRRTGRLRDVTGSTTGLKVIRYKDPSCSF